jgi:hypothetical protein
VVLRSADRYGRALRGELLDRVRLR